jgi:hypothetical protein
VNADYLIPRQLIAWEETLCERCHDASGPATKNIQDEINKRITGSGHPTDDTALAGRHVASESLPITSKHVECYDCHNPHAVKAGTNTPGDGDGGRVKGMKYIDINGVVQNPAPIGTRSPYIQEVCFKCHGNSFDCIMTYKALGASDGTAGCTPLTTRNRGGENGAGYNAQLGASNKRKEFDPTTIIGTTHGADNTKVNGAYHPVASPGRNTSIQLCNQLKTAFNLSCANQATATTELSNLTINCTDCHNNNDVDTIRGPITESSLRSTDKPSGYAGTLVTGPHGSTKKRLLRGDYPTLIGSGNCTGWGGSPPVITDRICFRCHDNTPFTTSANSTWTNFFAGGFGQWSNSMHYFHLSQATQDNIPIQCHECHNNVHSNVEANNTQYHSGAACCTGFPADGNTHLLNFGPQATADQYAKPAWYVIGGLYACNLRCHGKTMTSCRYRGTYDGSAGGGGWC